MTKHPLRLLLASLIVTAPIAFASGGCSRQGEGDRCSLLNGNEDCSGGLVCTPANELRGGEDEVDRCCPAEDRADAVPSCRPRAGSGSGTGGTSGTGDGGAGGAGGSAN